MKKLISLFTLTFCFLFIAMSANAQNVTVNPGAGSYPTLKAAFDAINAGTHTGAVTVSIDNSTTETVPCVLNSSGAGSASYTSVSIFPSNDGITVSGLTTSGRGVIELNAADNVSIDGDNPNTLGTNRNLTIRNTAAATVTYTSVVRIALSTTINTTAINNTVKNCIINGSAVGRNKSTATSTTGSEHTTYGILVGGGASTTSGTTAPSAITSVSTTIGSGITATNFTADNNSINACARGIAVQGSAITVANKLKVLNNLIGSSTAGDTTTVYSRATTLQGFDSCTVSGNTIQNIESFIGTSTMGLSLGDISSSGTNALVTKNVVNNVFNQSATTFGAYGINLIAGNANSIINNSVSQIRHVMTGGGAFSTTFGVFGIRVAAGLNHKVLQNSVNLFGAYTGTANSSLLSAALAITGTGLTGCDLRNNLLSNTITGGTTSISHVSLFLPSGGTSAMNLTLNNNAYYSGTTVGAAGICQVGTTYSLANLYLASNFDPNVIVPASNLRAYSSTLSAAGTNDNASIASTVAAPFTSSSNLHIPAGTGPTKLESGGASVGVTTDIDGDVRPGPSGSIYGGAIANDIGCDEFDGIPAGLPDPNDVGTTAITSSQGTLYSCPPYAATDFTVTVKNYGTATQTIIPVYYSVNGGSPVGPVNTVGPILTGGTENVLFNGANSFTPPGPGTYVVKTYTALGTDTIRANDTASLTITVNPVISTYPYIETWNNLAAGWSITVENAVGTTALFGLSAPVVGPRGIAGDTAMVMNFFNGSAGRREILKSPVLNLSTLTNPVVDFYTAYKTYTGGESDTLQVVVSTDCGVTFFSASTVYNKSWDSNPSLATRPPSASSFVPDSAIQWRHETISLANVAGQSSVILGFRAKSDFGNLGWIDNIIVTDVSSLCSDAVTGPGTYNCNALVKLDFTATPAPPPSSGNNFITDNGINKSSIDMNTFGSLPISTEKVNVITNNNDNPLGGNALVSQYTSNNPGQTVAPNVGFTNATPPVGPAYDPTFVYHDYWFTVTYTGNDYTGYATYDIKIDLDGLVFTDPSTLYVVKRADKTAPWVCQNTTMSGNTMIVTGLKDFSDFALAGSEALPVELSSFVSTINGRNVELNWATTSETNNSGFDIERSSVNGSWTKVGNVAGNGTTTTGHSYSFTDRNVATGNYSYRLKQTDFNGNFEYFNLSNEVVIGIPSKYELSQNYPNPFNPSTKISYDLPSDGKVSLKIFDMSGKEIMTLVNEVKTAGYYSVSFNASGLSSGVYFYRLTADNFTATKKMMLVK